VLGICQDGHQAQVVADGVAFGELAQALRAQFEDLRAIGQADARDGALGERLNLPGF